MRGEEASYSEKTLSQGSLGRIRGGHFAWEQHTTIYYIGKQTWALLPVTPYLVEGVFFLGHGPAVLSL